MFFFGGEFLQLGDFFPQNVRKKKKKHEIFEGVKFSYFSIFENKYN
jgi:hypothetical protein